MEAGRAVATYCRGEGGVGGEESWDHHVTQRHVWGDGRRESDFLTADGTYSQGLTARDREHLAKGAQEKRTRARTRTFRASGWGDGTQSKKVGRSSSVHLS